MFGGCGGFIRTGQAGEGDGQRHNNGPSGRKEQPSSPDGAVQRVRPGVALSFTAGQQAKRLLLVVLAVPAPVALWYEYAR